MGVLEIPFELTPFGTDSSMPLQPAQPWNISFHIKILFERGEMRPMAVS